jgi:hypothetical protein
VKQRDVVCRLCGRPETDPDDPIQVHHLLAVSRGGGHSMENMVSATRAATGSRTWRRAVPDGAVSERTLISTMSRILGSSRVQTAIPPTRLLQQMADEGLIERVVDGLGARHWRLTPEGRRLAEPLRHA